MSLTRELRSVQRSVTVTKSDDDDITLPSATQPVYPRGIYVGVAGNVNVMYVDGTTDILTNLVAGIWHPMHIRRILSTSTTATDLHAGW